MTDVGVWSPGDTGLELTIERLTRLSSCSLDAEDLGLERDEVHKYGALMRVDGERWRAACAGLSDDFVVALIKVLTVAEMRLPGWEAGAKSPVIVLVRELRDRGSLDATLIPWIKANTDNKYLPHGSLMDRL